MNRTIMEKVRSMLVESGLKPEFWAEAASTAVHIINRSPSASIDFEGTKGYRVWLLDEQKVVLSRNVIFEEDMMFKELNGTSSAEKQSVKKTKKKVTFDMDLNQFMGESSTSEDTSNECGAVAETENSDQNESSSEESESETESET
ncbi:unnamed protein product [Microthlaspi erraticum]|uniref:Retroviral polymerase SH3-like domain-containing protein n=1 Tax=Microthlaspi erraticum TaxID=1685480 RepID=A0A6D2HXU5_9BRAS|nr:unnamed protein product [Microthlaspi erraticum]